MISLRLHELRLSLPLANKLEELRGARLHRTQLHLLITDLDRKIHRLEDIRAGILSSPPDGGLNAPFIGHEREPAEAIIHPASAAAHGDGNGQGNGGTQRHDRLQTIRGELRRLQRERRQRMEELARLSENVDMMENAVIDHQIESVSDVREKLDFLADILSQGVEFDAYYLAEALDGISAALSRQTSGADIGAVLARDRDHGLTQRVA